MEKKIIMSKEIGEYIATRNSIASIFNKINELSENNIIMDFKGVKFISRSPASEYLKLREKTDKNLTEKNMSDEVKSMFSLVVNQFKKADFEFTKDIPIFSLKTA